ncbi:MAG: type II toxin-antitoxin system VapC family toxin [Hyphomonadaceae bacterium]|nr:type II toxin-antitoxin system VapC family toxin [Hyphomonadaceae bacterium]
MIGVLVPDSSIIAKLFLREAESDAVSELLEQADVATAPQLLALEVASAITRRYRIGGIERVSAEGALEDARSFFGSAGIALVPDAQVQARAEEIALDLKHPLKDCLFVALAEREQATLVTLDASLLARASPHHPFVRSL